MVLVDYLGIFLHVAILLATYCNADFQPTISLEMPVPSQGHYGFHSFPVVD
jgi:hypothetical protein